ncbi:MAG: hypothetical protein WC216_11140 [Gallionella sp.]|jgi:hypothetical protein
MNKQTSSETATRPVSDLTGQLDPFAYNKDFDPQNAEHFNAWLDMRPPHLSEGEWQFQVGRLKLLLESQSVKTEYDRSIIMVGWKHENGLWA